MLGVDGRLGGTDGKITPNAIDVPNADAAATGRARRSCRWASSSTTRAPRSMWRGLILTKALEQFLTDVRWGELDYLLDRHAARHRRHPDGPRPHAAAGGDARGHHARARRAEGRGARRRHGAALVHEGRGRGREHERVRARPTAPATRCSASGGGDALAAEIGAPLVARIPLEPAVSAGGDTGTPIVLSRARQPGRRRVPRARRPRSSTDLLPPIEMSGCTARMLDLLDEVGRSRRAT